jgi:hypothetical protein
MKIVVLLSVILAGALFVLSADAKQFQPKPYLEGTVVRVDKHQANERVPGENPSDAPLADPAVFSYDVAIHVNCGTYVGRYQSWYDYVPSVFKNNQKIQLRLTRSAMYVNVPNEKEVELNIVSRHIERSGPCDQVASR